MSPGADRRPLATPIALSALHRRSLYVIAAGLVLSGAGWLVCHFVLAVDPEMDGLPHPMEPFWLKLHGAAGMIGLLSIGTVIPAHAWRAWRARRNHGTGLVFGAALSVMAVTGWALYYVGSEAWRPAISAVHWAAGLSLVPALAWHVTAGRRLRGGRGLR